MSTRKRIIYQSESIFVGPSPAISDHTGKIKELTRVQSASSSFQVTHQDINQFGSLAAYSREIIDAPTVSVDVNYYLTNGGNENKLGFVTDGAVSAISGFLNGATDEKNVFIMDVGEGVDAIGTTTARADHVVTAIGNAYLSNYTVDASVGQPPSASATFDALNINYEKNSSGNFIPAIIAESGIQSTAFTYEVPIPAGFDAGQVAALRPGDITLDLVNPIGATTSGEGSAHIQSFSLSVPIGRENLDRLGSKFSFSKEVAFPVTVTMSVTANMADVTTGRLAEFICEDDTVNALVTMREPSCGGVASPVAMKYELKGAKLDSQSQSLSIGSSKTVDLTFSTQLSGPEDLENGLFIFGSYVPV